MGKCVYCNGEVPAGRAMEICDRCGVGVWGPKQWENIKKTTDEAQERGDLALFKEQEENKKVQWRDVVKKVA